MTISLFASGLLDFRLAGHVLTQAPQTLSEAERIALEFLQIRRGIGAARPRFKRSDPMPSLLGDSQPIGDTTLADPDQESEQAPPDSFEIDAGDDDMALFTPAKPPADPKADWALPLATPLAALPLA